MVGELLLHGAIMPFGLGGSMVANQRATVAQLYDRRLAFKGPELIARLAISRFIAPPASLGYEPAFYHLLALG